MVTTVCCWVHYWINQYIIGFTTLNLSNQVWEVTQLWAVWGQTRLLSLPAAGNG